VTEEGIHQPYRLEPDIVEGPKHTNLGLWVLELGARRRFNGGLKKRNEPWPYYKEGEYQEPSP